MLNEALAIEPVPKDVFSASDAFMADVEHTCLGLLSRASRFPPVLQLCSDSEPLKHFD